MVRMASNKREGGKEQTYELSVQSCDAENKINQDTKGHEEKTLFNCMYTTAWSLGNKHRELELLIYEHKFDLVGITETWCEGLHDWNIKIS